MESLGGMEQVNLFDKILLIAVLSMPIVGLAFFFLCNCGAQG